MSIILHYFLYDCHTYNSTTTDKDSISPTLSRLELSRLEQHPKKHGLVFKATLLEFKPKHFSAKEPKLFKDVTHMRVLPLIEQVLRLIEQS